ncbi:bifunctional methylenetetrahydrofolate dehydrogenase/methenyltetrahydrofolate cyclohydrolase FolD [Sulfobacillus thermosulfidooxidans]|uniref:bifunctional methylenetetrahydrofolate dehydrogenase/methenyltetrahydrofolate cyclohydrolase FolD n=1 Tax=Sulfobacillus thermosulfidooxidans TaxID=28034 RepID=UPI00096B7F48|nr:bifunctional methylenetetrahydrofolate dehydrogenase/methenyltetrahydrofolate cyclohydrolase FolD [Sulfobacillus thermosulfidooxidans]OLZ08537.1 bifunctional methylenetetrahydrofolate dehydrogenase/methenyltetrahydrofolate cyclohydrolase [Sulfobacillus thermosulfidooxidans]OLZ13139.1 bifunctional methylenetetrahydrofolate dehydrogenase/methenyltetrahydrofolate cyclohydrolase [Sulfobacillus thermosulfidooxidans]OLZ21519.1 bifunctional methylenetetrahydrofolate dehydrogenase/methenyltetrahydrof
MATAQLLDGKRTAQIIREELAKKIEEHYERTTLRPGLAVVLVGDDPASKIYVRNKHRASTQVGMDSRQIILPAHSTTSQVLETIEMLNQDPSIHGILLQLPVPRQIDAQVILRHLDPRKDVDGLTPTNMGRLMAGQSGLRPCTPLGIIELLDRYHVPLEGQRVVVIGRSQLVGRPLALMFVERNATVTIVHSKTPNAWDITREADIVVAAVGHAHLVQPNWIKPGATVIDVGINRTESGIVGDVDFDSVAAMASRITPVPGGIGPMTIAMLLSNTWQAFQETVGS